MTKFAWIQNYWTLFVSNLASTVSINDLFEAFRDQFLMHSFQRIGHQGKEEVLVLLDSKQRGMQIG